MTTMQTRPDGGGRVGRRGERGPEPGVRLVLQKLKSVNAVTPMLLLVCLASAIAFTSPDFFTSQGAANSVVDAGPLILAVLALVPIAMSAPAGVDLSIGPLMVLVNVTLVSWLFPLGLTGAVWTFAFAIVLAVIFEVIQGLVIALVRLQPIVVTLSGYLVLGGLNLVILPQAGGSVPNWLSVLGSPTQFFSPSLYVLIGCFVLWAVFSRTTIARNISLLGGNDRASYASGLRLASTRIAAHVVSGVFAGIGGVLLTGLLQSADPTSGPTETLTAVTALVVGGATLAGGRTSGMGAVLGAIDIYMLGYFLGVFNLGNASSYITEAANGVVLVAALVAGYLVARSRRRSEVR